MSRGVCKVTPLVTGKSIFSITCGRILDFSDSTERLDHSQEECRLTENPAYSSYGMDSLQIKWRPFPLVRVSGEGWGSGREENMAGKLNPFFENFPSFWYSGGMREMPVQGGVKIMWEENMCIFIHAPQQIMRWASRHWPYHNTHAQICTVSFRHEAGDREDRHSAPASERCSCCKIVVTQAENMAGS